MNIKYTQTEEILISYDTNLAKVSNGSLEDLAFSIDNNIKLWYTVKLGKCSNTNTKTYVLHTSYVEPKINYCDYSLINKDILEKGIKDGINN